MRPVNRHTFINHDGIESQFYGSVADRAKGYFFFDSLWGVLSTVIQPKSISSLALHIELGYCLFLIRRCDEASLYKVIHKQGTPFVWLDK